MRFGLALTLGLTLDFHSRSTCRCVSRSRSRSVSLSLCLALALALTLALALARVISVVAVCRLCSQHSCSCNLSHSQFYSRSVWLLAIILARSLSVLLRSVLHFLSTYFLFGRSVASDFTY